MGNDPSTEATTDLYVFFEIHLSLYTKLAKSQMAPWLKYD